MSTVVGRRTEVWTLYKAVHLREGKMMEKALKLSRPGNVKQKEFRPKNNLPRLPNYSVDPPQSYWDKWNKLTFSDASFSSWLNPTVLVKVSVETGYNDMNHVKFVSNYLTHGAKIGCEGEGRWPTRGRNDPYISIGPRL